MEKYCAASGQNASLEPVSPLGICIRPVGVNLVGNPKLPSLRNTETPKTHLKLGHVGGKRPLWFSAALKKKGVTAESLLIGGPSEKSAPAKKAAKKAPAKKVAKK